MKKIFAKEKPVEAEVAKEVEMSDLEKFKNIWYTIGQNELSLQNLKAQFDKLSKDNEELMKMADELSKTLSK